MFSVGSVMVNAVEQHTLQQIAIAMTKQLQHQRDGSQEHEDVLLEEAHSGHQFG